MKSSLLNVFKECLRSYLLREGMVFLEAELSTLSVDILNTAVFQCNDIDSDFSSWQIETGSALIRPSFQDLCEEREIPTLLVFREVKGYEEGSTLIGNRRFVLAEFENIYEIEEMLRVYYDETVVVLIDGKILGYQIQNIQNKQNHSFDRFVNVVIWGDNAYMVSALDNLGNDVEEFYNSRLEVKNQVKGLVKSNYNDIEIFSILDKKELFYQIYTKLADSSDPLYDDDTAFVFVDAEGNRTLDIVDDVNSLVLPF